MKKKNETKTYAVMYSQTTYYKRIVGGKNDEQAALQINGVNDDDILYHGDISVDEVEER